MGAMLICMRLFFRRGATGYQEAVMTDEEIVTRVSGIQLAAMGPAPYVAEAAPPPPSYLSHHPQPAAAYASPAAAEPYATYHQPQPAYASIISAPVAAAAYHTAAAQPANNYELSSAPRELCRFDAAYCHLLFSAMLDRHRALLQRETPTAKLAVLEQLGAKLHAYALGSSFALVLPGRCFSSDQMYALDDMTLVQHAADVLDELESQIEALRSRAAQPPPDRPRGF